MSSIIDIIGRELSELFALEFTKIAEYDCLHPSIYKCRPIGTKHGHNILVYDTEILNASDYGSNPTLTCGVIALE